MNNFIDKPILNERFDKSLYFREINCSGLGDRLNYIYLISILSYIKKKNCILTWYNTSDENRIYNLNTVKKYISFPKWVEIIEREKYNSQYDDVDESTNQFIDSWRIEFNDINYINLNKGQYIFHDTSKPLHLSIHSDLNSWMNLINSKIFNSKYEIDNLCKKAKDIAKLFNINFNLDMNYKYLCLHFRGGDKRQEGQGMYNSKYNTSDILKKIKTKSKLPIVLVSDDNTEFIKTHNIDISLLEVPSLNITDYTTYCIRDLYILQSSIGIIQHSPHGWSSFSNFINIIKNKPLISTCRNDYNIYYPDIFAYINGKKFDNFYNYNEIDNFLLSI
jgi:hypothetical protein